MPELPEVETVRKTLKNRVLDHKIISFDCYWPNIIIGDQKEFAERIIGQTIGDVLRRGKYLLFMLDTDVIISHLRMEGKYYYSSTSKEKEKHTHVIFHLDKDKDLRYYDVRKFGTLQVVDKQEFDTVPPISLLGKEPFDMTAEELYERFKSISLPIKSALLNQKWVAGIGNIYANEICFAAKINPYKKAKDLSIKEIELIVEKSKEILNKAISLGGTTIHSFSNEGITGLFQQELFVHGLKNQKCLLCGDTIVKVKLQQRGTYYCPTCQGVKKE